MGLNTVFVVDDDVHSRELIAALLSTHCHVPEVHAFGRGEEAIAAMASRGSGAGTLPDFMLLDFHMPGMNALAVLASLDAAGLRVPVAVISGAARPEEQCACLAAGARAFIHKTQQADALVARLRELTREFHDR